MTVDLATQAIERKNAAEKALASFLSDGSLYTLHKIDSDLLGSLPSVIDLYCADCGKKQKFSAINWTRGGNAAVQGWGETVEYKCRNCNEKRQKYFYVWQSENFWKVGQLPELRESISNSLNKALGGLAPFYKKAVRSRSFGFGIGSLAYLRRIVEDSTDTLLDLLKEDKWDMWSEVEKAEFEQARKTYQYAQKIDYAAAKILPQEVFASGRNSFAALHDVTSNGVHGKSEEECLQLFDLCNLVFTHSFRVLADRRREREDFEAQLLKLKR